MLVNLSTVHLKMDRAEKHFADFKTALGLSPDAKYTTRTSGIHLQEDGTLHYTTDLPEPGPEVSIILGDAIHQLRSSLDHLICLFARRTNPLSVCEDAKLAFPIKTNDTEFRALWQVSQGVLEAKIGSLAFTAIKRAQPYKRNPLLPTRDPLYILSKLDNIDKHRIVIVFGQALATSGYVHQEGVKTRFKTTQPVKPGSQVLSIDVPLAPDKPVAYEVENLTPHITFAETNGVCDGEPVFPLFRDMQKAVREVIADFAVII